MVAYGFRTEEKDKKELPKPDPKYQIEALKKQFPEQLGNVKALDGDKLNFAQFDTFSNKTDLYQKIVSPELKPASATTGQTILTASKELKSFEVLQSPFQLVQSPEIEIGTAWRSKTNIINFRIKQIFVRKLKS